MVALGLAFVAERFPLAVLQKAKPQLTAASCATKTAGLFMQGMDFCTSEARDPSSWPTTTPESLRKASILILVETC